MSVDLLAISVGNSRVHAGVFLDEKLVEQASAAHDDQAEQHALLRRLGERLAAAGESAAYLASVHESAGERIVNRVIEDLGLEPQRMETDVPIPIGRQLDAEAIVGEDRLLCAAAAYDRLGEACVVVDAGTALTVDFIDGTGTFHGGAILAGGQMQLDALHAGTDQLPSVQLSVPEESIGHSTTQAMLCGAYHGLRGAVRELVERYAEIYRGWPKVMATGGNASLLFDGYDLVEAIVPDLALMGMAVARRHALNPSEE